MPLHLVEASVFALFHAVAIRFLAPWNVVPAVFLTLLHVADSEEEMLPHFADASVFTPFHALPILVLILLNPVVADVERLLHVPDSEELTLFQIVEVFCCALFHALATVEATPLNVVPAVACIPLHAELRDCFVFPQIPVVVLYVFLLDATICFPVFVSELITILPVSSNVATLFLPKSSP